MGFLRLDRDIPLNLNKGIFSCFFLITPAVVAAVAARDASTSSSSGAHVMDKCIPLITWGGQQTSTSWGSVTGSIGECCDPFSMGDPEDCNDVTGRHFDGTEVPVQQSFIGIRFPFGGSGDWTPALAIHIQGANPPVVTGGYNQESFGFNCPCVGEGGALSRYEVIRADADYVTNVVQTAHIGNTEPETQIGEGETGSFLILQVGVWQHVLVSWQLDNEAGRAELGFDYSTTTPIGDIGAHLGVASSSKLYCAVNGANKAGEDLPAAWPGWGAARYGAPSYEPNSCVSPVVYVISDGDGYIGTHTLCNDRKNDYQPSVSLNWGTIPSNPIWIPGPPTCAIDDDRGSLLIPNQGVIQSHLQLFSGVTVDTSLVDKVRLFITSEGKPADPKAAQNALGKKPAIQFIKTSDWTSGTNKGSAGNFAATGGIANYTPGPSA